MVRAEIAVDDKSVQEALGKLQEKADIIIARAANRSMATANKAMSQGVRKKYVAVKDGDVREALHPRQASARNPVASLTYKSKHENVYRMGRVSPKRIVRGNDPKVYKARVMTDEPFKPLKGRPRPFVQRMPENGFVGLFRRRTKDQMTNYRGTHRRNAIETVQAPALSQMLKNEEVLENTQKVAGEVFLKRLEHEIDWELRK